MAQLNDTLVSGALAAQKIYENGTAIDDKFGSSLELNTTSSAVEIKLKNVNGGELGNASIPLATVSSEVSVTNPSINITTKTNSILTTNESNYYIEIGSKETNGSVSSSVNINSAGYISSSLGSKSGGSGNINSTVILNEITTPYEQGGPGTVYNSGNYITYTVLDDNSIKINGATPAETWCTFSLTRKLKLEAGKKYRISR